MPVAAGTPPVDLAAGLVRSIRTHPKFSSAIRESARVLVEEHARNRLLNRLISDRGRAQFGIPPNCNSPLSIAKSCST